MSIIETESKLLERAVIDWINTFPELSKRPEILDDLFDGQILAEIMHKIAPQQIDLSNISPDSGMNFVLRMNNLTYLYEGIAKFYINVLGKPFDKSYVDIMSLAKNGDHTMLYNLIEYILGVVVQCEQKEIYIPAILTLDENSQTLLMLLIEKILTKFDKKNTSMDMMNTSFDTKNNILDKQNSSFIAKENKENRLLQKLDELELENNMLNNKLDEVIDERDRLKSKLSDLHMELAKKSDEIKQVNSQKEQIMKQLSAQEANEDLQNELKFKDKKIFELNKYSEELRSTHEAQMINMRNELDNYKKKVAQLSKIENTLDFYKEKYEDCAKLSQRVGELEAQNDALQAKIQEHEKQTETMNAKIKKVVDQYTAEKDKNINLELTITKKDAEIETLKNDGKRLDASISDLEIKVFEQHKLIEQYKHDLEDNSRIQNKTERAIAMFSNPEDNSMTKARQNAALSSTEDETERELLRKDNELLSEKCKNLQKDNELLKIKIESELARQIEKLTRENDNLKDEVNRLKTSLISITNENASKEVLIAERKKLLDEVESLKQKIEIANKNDAQKENYIGELRKVQESSKIIKDENENLKKIISQNNSRINDLKNEVDCQKRMFNELDDQKEEELRVLASAFHELALRNLELEKKLIAQNTIEQKIKNTNTSPASGAIIMKNNIKK